MHYMDRFLTPHELGTRALYPWLTAPNYMTWYMKISHPYLEPLPAGDPPRPAELDANINDEAQDDGQRMATYVSKMLHIRQMIYQRYFYHQYMGRDRRGGPSTQ